MCDEAVVGTGVGHGKNPRARVLADELFIGDGLTTGAVALGEVAALAREVGSRRVEDAAALPGLTGAAVAHGRAVVVFCLAASLLVLLQLGSATERAP